MNLYRAVKYIAAAWTVFWALPLGILAQNTPCRAVVAANRHRIVKIDDLSIGITSWTDSQGRDVRMAGDSVWIQKNGMPVAAFRTENGFIAGPLLVQYEAGYIQRTDSLRADRNGHPETYFGKFAGRTAYTRHYYPDGGTESIRYYRRNGYDSLFQKRFPGGAPQQTVHYYLGKHSGDSDSATFTYYPTGVLQQIRERSDTREYSPEGILRHSRCDVRIDGIWVTRFSRYYDGGSLRSVEYFMDTIPCHTWFYYTEQGTLEKTVRHTPVSALVSAWGVGVPEPAPKIFTTAEVPPQFPGGPAGLEKYLNGRLCQSRVRLRGVYTVGFSVQVDGSVRLLYIEGRLPKAQTETLSGFITGMPGWKPGIVGGQKVNVHFRLRMTIG